jgi:hypothetical protein
MSKAEGSGAGVASDMPPLLGAMRDSLTPGRGAFCAVNPGNIVEAFRYAVAICLEIKPKKETRDPEVTAEGVPGPTGASPSAKAPAIGGDAKPKKAPKFADLIDKGAVTDEVLACMVDPSLSDARIVASRANLLLAVSMLGTHGGKIPDARIPLGALMPSAEVVAASAGEPGVHSGSVATSHPMSGSGNAAQNAHMRLLCAPLALDGGFPTSLAAVLAGRSPDRDAILAAFSEEAAAVLTEVGTAVEQRMSSGGGIPSSIPGNAPQILFPLGDGQYVAVSPLYPYSLGAELHARHQARVWGKDELRRQLIETRLVHVGGTKPWNTGVLATYLSGRFPRLVAMPQRQSEMTADRLVRQFKTRGLSLTSGSVSSEMVTVFLGAVAAVQKASNVRTNAAVRESVGAMCDAVLADVAVVARENGLAQALDGKPLVEDIGRLPEASAEVALLLGMIPDRSPSDDELDAAASRVASKVADRLHGSVGKNNVPFVADGEVIHLITGIARQHLEEFA